ncbi:MAG: glycoside hydrolase family 25 protein [Coriobacteriales bacterium]|jgi:GH25 family lysozyme M1 (1,4-beta-N-acetylmuramidase)|nr:glycoside hydrolase family 25 protein [Coriobacteriales bacterium]
MTSEKRIVRNTRLTLVFIHSMLAHGAFILGTLTLGTLLLATLALGACSGMGSGGPNNGADLPFESPYESPYNPEGLIRDENGRFAYWKDGALVSHTGVDVSSHQGSIDWKAVAADGIDFAFLRIGHRGYTEGEIYLDECFEDNYVGATSAGLPVGVYFFSQALNEDEAREEAHFVLETLGGRTPNYPIVYDFEPVSDVNGRANALDARQRTRNALAFCEVIKQAGYAPMLYGNAQDRAHYYADPLEGYPFWFAEYGTEFPSGQFDFSIWQYSSSGEVAGITTAVDMNLEFAPTP